MVENVGSSPILSTMMFLMRIMRTKDRVSVKIGVNALQSEHIKIEYDELLIQFDIFIIMKIKNITKEEMIILLNNSHSMRNVLQKIHLSTNGSGNYRTLINRLNALGIDRPKYNYYGNGQKRLKKDNKDVFCENSTYPRQKLKERIIKEKILDYKCNKCNNNGNWMNNKLSLHLDHINGINNDNRIENLRFLCPNCHSQTETYSGKNVKKDDKDKIKNFCKCGKQIFHGSKMCTKCNSESQRKIKIMPTLESMEFDIKNLGYRGTGRKYNVSDTTIRKWINVMRQYASG